MSVQGEIQRLSQAAVEISAIPNPELRHKGGFWLDSELKQVYETHLFTQEERIDFMAIVKILLDVVFRDAVENADDLHQEFIVEPSSLDSFIDLSQQKAIEAATEEFMKD